MTPHLIDWLQDGYTHCQNGSEEWCQGYLTDAADEITGLRAERDRLRQALTEIVTPIANAGTADDPYVTDEEFDGFVDGWLARARAALGEEG